jgi:hypothetical protein
VKGGLKVLATIEDTFDKYVVRRDDKRNGDAALEPVTRKPGKTSSRCVPLWGKVVNPLQKSMMRLI